MFSNTAAFLSATTLQLQKKNARSFPLTTQTRPKRNQPYQAAPRQKRCRCRPGVTMLEQNTILAVITILAGVGGGIGLVAWTETQGKRTEERENVQPCTECKGEKSTACNVCKGTCKDPIDPELACSYCDAMGSLSCFNCGGSGIQPRFLDRLSPDDFMD